MEFGETTNARGEIMNYFEFKDKLVELKLTFFQSKYSTVDQFARYSGLWPNEYDPKFCRGWNNEKRQFMEKALKEDKALRETYTHNLNERVALANKMIDMLHRKLETQDDIEELNVKEMHNIVQSIQKLADIQDKSLSLLKIDAIQEDKFNENKASILDALRRFDVKAEDTTPKKRTRKIGR